MSALLRKFTDYEAKYSNYFNIDEGEGEQFLDNPESGEHLRFNFTHHNIDACPLPFDEKFDVILFCEVLEHLTIDPMRALLHIKNALQENGYLILSTPNVNRLENVARIISGSNIYDPYSGYGYYGRHNREYNKHELFTLLNHLGFEVEIMFSSDVHDNRCELFFPARKLREILEVEPRRLLDLGQYIFIRARNARPANTLRPDWLFRSYPANEMMQP
jgi:SAM-dependent methyltransferase